MGLVATQPLKVGDRVVDPGYEFTREDMQGRNMDMLVRQGKAHYEANTESAPRKRGRPPASE